MNPNESTINYSWYWNCFNYDWNKRTLISMCAIPRSICIFVFFIQQKTINYTHSHTHTPKTIHSDLTTIKLHLPHSHTKAFAYHSQYDVRYQRENEKENVKFSHFDKWNDVKCDTQQCNGYCIYDTVRWSRSNVSLSLYFGACVFTSRFQINCSNTVKFQRVYFYVFSLWYTYELANKMADRPLIFYDYVFCLSLSRALWFQIQRNEIFQVLVTFYLTFAHTHSCTHSYRTHNMRARACVLNTHKKIWEMKLGKDLYKETKQN